MILETLIVKLVSDISQYKSGLAEAESTASTTATNIASKFSSVGASLTKFGAIGTATITAPLIALGTASVNSASDLEESMNKTRVVFGESGADIIAWSEDTASAMGISQQVALEATGTFGNLFSTMGLGTSDAADMSTSLVQLSSDLASFNNLNPEEVLLKLRSGLVGETEPLRALGINLSAATVQTKAFELGLADADGNLSQAALATARYQLIMEQTSLAQGDFANTSDGLANSTRIAKAEFANLSAEFGTVLLPLATELLKALIPLVQKISDLDPNGKKAVVIVGAIAAAIPPLMSFIGMLSSGIGGLISLFGAGGGLAGVGAALSGTVLPAIGSAIAFLATNPVGWLILAIGALIFVIVKFGKDAWNTLMMLSKIIQTFAMNVSNWIRNTVIKAFEGVSNAIKSVIDWVKKLIDKFKNIVIPSWLKPGSPTPFEMGLRGINNVMKKATLQILPKYTAQLNMAGVANPTGGRTTTGNSEIVKMLGEINSKKELDVDALARALRDAILQAV